MKVGTAWLKELVEIKDIKEVIKLLPLRTIALREITDSYIELDMKGYNRADLLSMRGVAREVAAITDSKINYEENEGFSNKDLPEVSIQVEDSNLCPFYTLTRIENLTVKSSDEALVKKLADSGFRAINNVADLTNLIMVEFGQPLHAFDADKVKGTVSVRLAKKGEKLLTLDGKLRELADEDLVIADERGPIGLAGVMGGKDTEVSENTKSILLEAAIFNHISIRKTVQRHSLPSEASKRFLHGLTKKRLLQAAGEALKIYEELNGKITGFNLAGDKADPVKSVTLTLEKVNSLIGVKLTTSAVEHPLKSLGFKLASNPGGWIVEVPYFRLDIEIEEDLVEEVARMYGYEKIPSKELQGEVPEKIDQSLPEFLYNLKKSLADLGLTEVQTYSFFSTQVLQSLGFNEGNEKALKVTNPISSETEYLRTFIWPNLVEVISKNMKQGFKDIAIFEVGKIYQPGPKESYRLAIALMNGSDNPIEELISIAKKIKGINLEEGEVLKALEGLFHPNRRLGSLAEVHPRFLNNFGVEKRVAILEIVLEPIIPQNA